jgi:hypothetical protein
VIHLDLRLFFEKKKSLFQTTKPMCSVTLTMVLGDKDPKFVYGRDLVLKPKRDVEILHNLPIKELTSSTFIQEQVLFNLKDDGSSHLERYSQSLSMPFEEI